MKIGVISDSHDQRERILQAIEIFKDKKVEMVIHCGDWVAPFSAARFSALECPIKGVFGNNDGDKDMHRDKNSEFIRYNNEKLELEVGGKKVFVTHGHKKEIVDFALKSGRYDAVFSGHTHVAHVKKEGNTLWLNPGTLVDETSSEIKGMSIAVYDSGTNDAEIIKID
jgi:uncharacterized protein